MKLKRIRFGTGAIRSSNLRYKIARALRPKFNKSKLAGGSFDWTKGFDSGSMVIRDQGQSFSCGGQAAAYWRENQIRLLSGKYIPLSAKSFYSQVAYPGGGTTSWAMSTQFNTKGINTETDVPSIKNGLPPTELFMTDRSWITPALLEDAIKRGFLVKVTVGRTTDEIAQALVQTGGTIWQIDGEDGHAWLGTDPTYPTGNGMETWSHFMMQSGALMRNGKKTIKCPQSWGQNIGDNGFQYFTDDYIQSKYMVDVFTFLPRSAFTASGTPIQWLLMVFQNMLKLFH